MTLKKYLFTMGFATLICWCSWTLILFSIDPRITNWIGFLLFYVSLFLSLIGTFALLGFFTRFIALRQKLVFRLVQDAFRQSFFFSITAVLALILLSKSLFTWINLILIIAALSLLEMFLISYRGGK